MIGNGSWNFSNSKGYRVINKFGVNLDIDIATVPETIWSHGGQFPFLNSGIQMDIVSTSADDSLSGIGAQKLIVTSYDDSNVESVTEYDMNGLTRVQLAGTIKLISRIELSQVGSNLSNVGKINVVDRATGLIIYQSIEVGEGQTLSSVQMCPSGKMGVVKRVYAEYARSGVAFNNANMRFRVRKSNGTVLTKFPTVISPNNANQDHYYEYGGIEIYSGDIIYWECIGVSADNTPIAAGFDLELIDI